jgi:hypothetical protein
METEHPTVDLFFVFAYTHCKVRIYETEELFAKNVLSTLEDEGKIEYANIDIQDTASWQEVDTRLWMHLIDMALPELLSNAIPKTNNLARLIQGKELFS